MKIPTQDLENFIDNGLKGCIGVLVYGPDSGLIKETSDLIRNKILHNKINQFNFSEYNASTLKENLDEILSTLYSRSLNKEKRLIKISGMGSVIAQEFSHAIEKYKGDNFILLESDELTPTSGLRKFAENSKNIASIPCYHDEELGARKIITKILKSFEINIDTDALKLLQSYCLGDRMLIKISIEKLISYLGNNKKNVSIDDIKAIIDNDSSFNVDNLCHIVADKNLKDISYAIDSLLKQNISMILILRMIYRYFLRLYQVAQKLESGENITLAMGSLSPPVFYKNIEIFKKHLKSWSIIDIKKIIKLTIILEIHCKKSHTRFRELCELELIKIMT